MWNFGLIIFSPSCGKKRLSHNSYAYLHLDKDRASQCQNLFHNFVLRKPFSLRQNLFLCLGALSFCTYNCAFLLWNALPHSCSASNQNKFKVFFPLLFFARPFSFKTNCKAVYESFSACKFFCWRNSKTNTQLGFSTLRLHPWNVFLK